jgi:hypothetical protein
MAERAGSWARREARARNVEVLKGVWRPFALLAGGLVVFTVGLLAIVDNKLQGFALGLIVASAVWAVAGHVTRIAGASSYLLGSQGELWTADELRPLLGRGWRVMHHVPIDMAKADVDHVLVGPSGVYAVETKTSTRTWNVADPDPWLTKHLQQARYNAQQTRRLLQGRAQVRTEVRPLLVLWGESAAGPTLVDGVEVVAGRDLTRWLESQPPLELPIEAVDAIATGLERHIELADKTSGSERSLLVDIGPFEIARQLWLGVIGALTALFVTGFLWSVLPYWQVIIAVPILVGTAAWALRRIERVRSAATTALATSIVLLLMTVGVFVWAYAFAGR